MLEKELRESFDTDSKNEAEEDKEHGGSDGEMRLPEELKSKQELAERLRRALKEYEESTKSEKPESISITDPECRMMKGKGVNPSYNAQAAIDAKSRMVIGGYVVNACCDSSELIPVINDIRENAGKDPELVSTDKGYTRLEHLVELEERKIDGFISQRKRRKQDFVYDPEHDHYVCPEGEKLLRIGKTGTFIRYAISDCDRCQRKPSCWRKNASQRTVCRSENEEAALRMYDKISSDKGRQISILRASTIEPLFGTIKFAKRLRQLTVRGLQRVSEVWKLELAAYNLEKLCRVRFALA